MIANIKMIFLMLFGASFFLSAAQIDIDFDKYSKLEEKHPDYFNGFKKAKFPISNILKHVKNESDYFDNKFKNKEIVSLLEDLSEALGNIDISNDKIEAVRKELEKSLTNHSKSELAYFHLVYFYWKTVAAISEYTDRERDFFKVNLSAERYELFKDFDLNDNLIKSVYVFEKKIREAKGSDFHRSVFSYNVHDSGELVRTEIEKNGCSHRDVYLTCMNEGESHLGYFFLALMYASGYHPISCNLVTNSDVKLHGCAMSKCGERTHDEVHSMVDTKKYNAIQSAYYFISHYVYLAQKKIKEMQLKKELAKEALTNEDNKYIKSIALTDEVIKAFGEFSAAQYINLQHALVDILEKGLTKLWPKDDDKTLSDEFKAFAVAAFFVLHENPTNLSAIYATGQLELLLDEMSTTLRAPSFGDVFQITSLDGKVKLSDDEIYDLALKRLREKTPDLGKGYQIVKSYSIKKTDLYIECIITTIGNRKHEYITNTAHSVLLNIDHDLEMLSQAKSVLFKLYDYKIPDKLSEEDMKNEELVKGFIFELAKGKNVLGYHFYLTAKNLDSSIFEKFASNYEDALQKLSKKVPSKIVGRDLQQFFDEIPEAVKKGFME